MIELIPFIVLAFASFRITRFLIFDTIFAHTRQSFYVWLANRSASQNRIVAFFGHKALEGISCSWCLGVWVSFAVYWLYTYVPPQEWGRLGWLSFAGIAGVQGLIHSFEPDDE